MVKDTFFIIFVTTKDHIIFLVESLFSPEICNSLFIKMFRLGWAMYMWDNSCLKSWLKTCSCFHLKSSMIHANSSVNVTYWHKFDAAKWHSQTGLLWIIFSFELFVIQGENDRKISLTAFLSEKMEYDGSD